jgi:hypothetical protein
LRRSVTRAPRCKIPSRVLGPRCPIIWWKAIGRLPRNVAQGSRGKIPSGPIRRLLSVLGTSVALGSDRPVVTWSRDPAKRVAPGSNRPVVVWPRDNCCAGIQSTGCYLVPEPRNACCAGVQSAGCYLVPQQVLRRGPIGRLLSGPGTPRRVLPRGPIGRLLSQNVSRRGPIGRLLSGSGTRAALGPNRPVIIRFRRGWDPVDSYRPFALKRGRGFFFFPGQQFFQEAGPLHKSEDLLRYLLRDSILWLPNKSFATWKCNLSPNP